MEQYYTANTQNAVEIDTYLTNPNQRHVGTARILVYEGIKKHIKKHFGNPETKKYFYVPLYIEIIYLLNMFQNFLD